MNLDLIQFLPIIISAISVIVGIVTLFKAFTEYRLQGIQKRADLFIAMRKRFKENLVFKDIASLLEDDLDSLSSYDFKEKRDYAGFFQEIAIMMNSGLISRNVTHYMFGYFAVKCLTSKNFWDVPTKFDPEEHYWMVFRNFALEMYEMDKKQKEKPTWWKIWKKIWKKGKPYTYKDVRL